MLTAPRAVLWDWDGTLMNSLPLLNKAINRVRADFGMEPEPQAETHRYSSMPKERIITARFGDRAAEAMKLYMGHIQTEHDTIAQDPFLRQGLMKQGSDAVLKALYTAGVPMGIVSNKTSSYLQREIELLCWEHYFVLAYGPQDLIHPKPDPRAALQALDAMGVAPGPDVWFVGDTSADMATAIGAGLTYICYAPDPLDLADDDPQADQAALVLASYDELLPHLGALLAKTSG